MENVPFVGQIHHMDAAMIYRQTQHEAWNHAVQSSIGTMNRNSRLLGSDESIRRLDASTNGAVPIPLDIIDLDRIERVGEIRNMVVHHYGTNNGAGTTNLDEYLADPDTANLAWLEHDESGAASDNGDLTPFEDIVEFVDDQPDATVPASVWSVVDKAFGHFPTRIVNEEIAGYIESYFELVANGRQGRAYLLIPEALVVIPFNMIELLWRRLWNRGRGRGA
jgi:hypothetical protein